VEVFFHFCPGRGQVLLTGDGIALETDEHTHAVLKLLEPNHLSTELRTGAAEPDGGWIATSYGGHKQAPLVRFHGRLQLPVSLAFALVPSLTKLELLAFERLPVHDGRKRPAEERVNYRICCGMTEEPLEFAWDCPVGSERLSTQGSP